MNAREGIAHIGGPFPRERYRREGRTYPSGCYFSYEYSREKERAEPGWVEVFGKSPVQSKPTTRQDPLPDFGSFVFPKDLSTNEIVSILRQIESVAWSTNSVHVLATDSAGGSGYSLRDIIPPIVAVDRYAPERLIVLTADLPRMPPGGWCEHYLFQNKTLLRQPSKREMEKPPLLVADEPKAVIIIGEMRSGILELLLPALYRDYGGIPKGTIITQRHRELEFCFGVSNKRVPARFVVPTAAWFFKLSDDGGLKLASVFSMSVRPAPLRVQPLGESILPLLPRPAEEAVRRAVPREFISAKLTEKELREITELILRMPGIHPTIDRVMREGREEVEVFTVENPKQMLFGRRGQTVTLKKVNGIWVIVQLGDWIS